MLPKIYSYVFVELTFNSFFILRKEYSNQYENKRVNVENLVLGNCDTIVKGQVSSVDLFMAHLENNKLIYLYKQ